MTNEVKHNEWVYRKFEGADFRAQYVQFGWTFCNLEIQKKNYIRIKKWIIFGPYVNIFTHWVSALSGKETARILPVMKMDKFYSKGVFDRDFKICTTEYFKHHRPDIEAESPEDNEAELEFLD